jgi:hypothetical protein
MAEGRNTKAKRTGHRESDDTGRYRRGFVIATSDVARNHSVGTEDMLTGLWLRIGN